MSKTLEEQKHKAVHIALHGTSKELEDHIEEVATQAEARGAEKERERIISNLPECVEMDGYCFYPRGLVEETLNNISK